MQVLIAGEDTGGRELRSRLRHAMQPPTRGERGAGGVGPCVPPARIRPQAALSLLDDHRAALRRTARRVSLCPDDAEDALQRATVILLTKGPPHPPRRLAAWMHVVTRREALALRRERERLLGGEVRDTLPSGALCPAERAELREGSRERVRLLARLKPDQRRALVLKAQGYSYREICELTGWTYTKVNRCLAEGRARLRSLAGAATAG